MKNLKHLFVLSLLCLSLGLIQAQHAKDWILIDFQLNNETQQVLPGATVVLYYENIPVQACRTDANGVCQVQVSNKVLTQPEEVKACVYYKGQKHWISQLFLQEQLLQLIVP